VDIVAFPVILYVKNKMKLGTVAQLVILALRRLKQEDHKFEASLSYIDSVLKPKLLGAMAYTCNPSYLRG
jgi:hypothetical protein